MKEFKYVIKDNEGIHARPAGETGETCKNLSKSSVMIEKRRKEKLTVRRSSALWDLVQKKRP